MKQFIRKYFFPAVDEDVQAGIDRESLASIYRVCLTVLALEVLVLISFIFTRTAFDRDTWLSLGSVIFCVLLCLVGALYTERARRKGSAVNHNSLTVFKIAFTLVLFAWAVWVSWRHYARDDELLTFFAVAIAIVCFIPLRPPVSVVILTAAYGALYYVIYSVDGGERVNIFNFIMAALVSIAGMVVRYHSQRGLSEKTVQLQRKNDQLEYMSRHDGLTGLRNRMALDEDVSKMLGTPQSVFMVDIDYFKEFNDRYGHSAGDAVLRETGKHLKELFPGARCYRYGGDEFLVITDKTEKYGEDTYRFSIPEVPGQSVLLGLGRADGTPADAAGLFALISRADESLYIVKKRTHSPEFGGHDRRRRP